MNFKMNSLAGAIGNVQLARLDGLLQRMRHNKSTLSSVIAGAEQTTMQRVPDQAGDASTSLIFFMETPALARLVVDALRAEGIHGCKVLYVEGEIDWHVYACWKDILAKRTWNRVGYPYCMAQRPIEYRVDMCPQSLGYLSRAVCVDVSPQLTATNLAQMSEALRKVLDTIG
jgi:dTDP-4-amino-4,6-dideoxygalactose transaminase